MRQIYQHKRNPMSTNSLKQFVVSVTLLGLALSASADLLPRTNLSGVVYLDRNNNGVFDAGDTGLGGVTLTLTGYDGGFDTNAVSLTTTTQPNGSYIFTNVPFSDDDGY